MPMIDDKPVLANYEMPDTNEPDDEAYMAVVREAATEFLDRCSLTPTPDAVSQLAEAFLPCLRIICERGYNAQGASWQEQGWRGQLYEIMKRSRRLEFFGWHGRKVHVDSARDIINYAGFLIRQWFADPDTVWGEWGDPE